MKLGRIVEGKVFYPPMAQQVWDQRLKLFLEGSKSPSLPPGFKVLKTFLWFPLHFSKRFLFEYLYTTQLNTQIRVLSNDSLVESFKPVLGSKPHSLYTTQLNTQIKVLSNDSLVETFKPVLGFKSRQPFHSKMVQLPTFCKFWTLVT